MVKVVQIEEELHKKAKFEAYKKGLMLKEYIELVIRRDIEKNEEDK